MKEQCLNGIIQKNLAIDIDITNSNSWNLNTGYTVNSLVNWNNRKTNDLNLLDFGLTGFDDGKTNSMNNNLLLTLNDKFTLYRIGYNNVINPITGETSGYTANTLYDLFPLTGITTGLTGNYFYLTGGYLQGFFKLFDYNYELFPSRYNNGITIETLLNINTNSEGIFYLMGLRAEDKYNPYFSGETSLITNTTKIVNNTTGNFYNTNGILTSEGNDLIAIDEEESASNAFVFFEDSRKIIDTIPNQINNLKNNIIAFEITNDKKIGYRYIDSNGNYVSNVSTNKIQNLGWNIISIVFNPYGLIDKYDSNYETCYDLRKGDLIFYVNGRRFWIINNFEEFYFKNINNDKEKQIGVPYNISWGGGSYGLKYSYHYDYTIYDLYNENNLLYINNKFIPTYNPTLTICEFTGNTDQYQAGLSLSANTVSYKDYDNCNNPIPLTVMDIMYTGVTGQTNKNFFIKFDQLIKVRPNIEYNIELLFNDVEIFNGSDSEISIVISGNTDYTIIQNTKYINNPIISLNNIVIPADQESGFYSDREENEYTKNGIIYDAITGYPVIRGYGIMNKGVNYNENPIFTTNTSTNINGWKSINFKFIVNNYNIDFSKFYFGFIIKSNSYLNANKHIYIKEFKYTAADILVKDINKENLIIEKNFNSNFIGGIQKLRIYDRALESNEILNNAYYESISNINYNILINRGGRIINI